ncbi:hypothetical protein NDU88_006715 [Pleurodeles waltl]|uniref:Uncharacterized protein n=1 Tax=Pleurodeles waltl TaxID=8319 RepID=A0AAV7NU44_PLEWA|nr:hypothetical protein NDU88_006715 [Pleurodeles waltl]
MCSRACPCPKIYINALLYRVWLDTGFASPVWAFFSFETVKYIAREALVVDGKRRARWRPRNAAAKRLLRPRKPPSVAAALPRVGASFGSRA